MYEIFYIFASNLNSICIMTHFFKQYPFSLLITCVIFYLSLCTVPETEMDDIPFIDKWAHVCMYGGLSGVLWIEYSKFHHSIRFKQVIFPTVIFPLLLSGIMELLQAYCTTTRNGDWLDMAANSLGVILGTVIGYFIIFPIIKKKKR